MSPPVWRGVRSVGAAATLAVVVWRLGAGPFLDGVRAVDGTALAAAAVLGLVTTVCCACRWTIVARGLGVDLALRSAIAAYYRSLFLNLTLPGGVVGDVHRGISHGREVRHVGRALRAVAWERGAGQAVQTVLTVGVLLALPSPVRSWMPLVVAGIVTTGAGALLMHRLRRRDGAARRSRLRGAVARDARSALLAPRALPAICLLSAVVVLAHAATFVVAARTAGVDASAARVLPLALLAMLAMVLPSVAGWGPREGATAWIFGAAGLGVDQGVATAVAYGVMALVASLPGAVVLLWAWRPGRRTGRRERGLGRLLLQRDGAADA